jgi:hypothetical protein
MPRSSRFSALPGKDPRGSLHERVPATQDGRFRNIRDNAREALNLLARRVDDPEREAREYEGRADAIRDPVDDSSFERVALPFVKNLSGLALMPGAYHRHGSTSEPPRWI